MNRKSNIKVAAAGLRRRVAPELRDLSNQPEHRPMMAELYRRAKAQLRKQRKSEQSGARVPKSEADPKRLLHELEVHQVELEMQNVELQAARDRMEPLLEKYTDLYDFAPVGYFTIATNGTIQQVNLTGANLVGIGRSRLVGQSFGHLVAVERRPVFNAFLKQVFASQTKQSIDLDLLSQGQPPRTVNISAQRLLDGLVCRVAVMDITDRKQAEEALHASEERFRAFVTASSDVVYRMSSDWSEMRQLHGRNFIVDTEKPSRAWLQEYIHPDDQPRVLAVIKEAIRTKTVFQMEHKVRRLDGTLGWTFSRAVPLLDAQGEILEWFGAASDVTERKNTEQELSEKARLLDLSHDAIIVRDMEGHIQYWNHGAEELYGWSQKEALGKLSHRLLKTEFPIPLKQMIAELHRTERWIGELVHTKRDGQRITVLARKTLDRDSRGKPAAVLENLTDITKRKQAEAALSASEERFRAAVGVVSSLIWTNNAKGLMEGEQPGWGKFTGQTKKEYQGYGWAKAVHPQDAPPTLAVWKQAVAKKKLFEFEHRLRRRDGEWRLCSIHAVPLLGDDGMIREWVGVHTDITDRKLAEAAQRRLAVMTASNRKLEQEIVRRQAVEKALQKSEQHQSRLLEESRSMQEQLRQLSRQILQAQEEERKRISRELHDVIAQTLTGINIRLATLKKTAGLNPKDFDRNITRTQQLVEKSVNLVHQFARELRPAVLDDLGLIPALHTFLKNFTAQTGVHTHLTAFAGVEQLDTARRTVLYRVAQEALTNVARHAKASHVAVNIQKLPDRICMKINDDGKSFQAERVLNAKGRKRLGLLGMRERLEMVGGYFDIESAPGKGTTIEVQIPSGKVAAQERGVHAASSSSIQSASKRAEARAPRVR